MRRAMLRLIPSVLLGLAVIAVGPLAAGAHGTSGAQEGVSVEVLGRGVPSEASGQQLTLLRATFAPEAVLRTHRHPGPMLLFIENGALSYTLVDGTAEIVRAGAAAGAVGSAATPEILNAGGETVLYLGDQLLERGVVHAARGAAPEPTVVLISALLTPGQPVTQFVD